MSQRPFQPGDWVRHTPSGDNLYLADRREDGYWSTRHQLGAVNPGPSIHEGFFILIDPAPARPRPPATAHSTILGIASWQQANTQDRRVLISLTGHRVEAHATKLSACLATRHLKFDAHLFAEDVPAVIDRAFAEDVPPITVAAMYDDISELVAEVG